MTTTMIAPHKDMTCEELVLWRSQQAGDFAYKNNQRREGWTQARSARWYGVGERQWQRYESGESSIPLALINRMREYEVSFTQTIDRVFDTTRPQLEKQGGIVP